MRKLVLSLLSILALLVTSVAIAQDEDDSFNLTILHTNDTHSHHEPDGDGNGGVARQATVQQQIAEEVENMVLLDAGDRFAGTLFYTQYLGQDNVEIMNALGYDAMVLGNHEFDNGSQVLADFVAGVDFPVLAANIDFSNSAELADSGIQASTVLDVNGTSVGVIGIDTADTPELASVGDGVIFTDEYVEVVNAQAASLMDEGVNIIILLTHVGIGTDLAMLESFENVDVVIGGHSHTLMGNRWADAEREYPIIVESPLGEPTVYVQAGEHNQYLGRLDLTFSGGLMVDGEGDTIFLSRYITPDPDLQSIVSDLAGPIEELRQRSIGATTDVTLVGDRTVCRVEECILGNIIADALRWETGADIAMMNGGGIRADIPAGEITLGEVLTVHPFGNLVSTFDLSGADIVEALENSVSRIQLTEDGQIQRGGASGRFMQVSGLRFTYNPEAEPGNRVTSVEVEQEDGSFAPIDPDATYSMATNNFVRGGGDGYTVFAEDALDAYDFGRLDYEVTADYLAVIAPIGGEGDYAVSADAPRIESTVAVEPRAE